MSKVIDERVVEMRFDNKQFEKATKETMGTLARLKEALKLPSISDSLKGMDKAAQKASGIDRIAQSVEALEKRFSMLGIVGMRVIENLTDGFMNKLTSAVNYATDAIISGGKRRAMNIENAHFQLQALLKDEAKVQEVMDDAMTSVDGTAYAFDEAAKAAAQFSASGIQAGEDMLGALKGITGVAAMTNSEFENISMIFTTVAGNGRLMGDQLLQLSSRGLNAASTIADYFREVQGQASITEGDIREMVSDGEISFKIFADAMNWAFGESAERANETFTGALANMRSALARIGAGFISPLVEQNSELVKLFNSLRIQINNVKSALVFDEQKSAISGLAKVTGITKDELSEMFATIKEEGFASTKQFEALNKKGADSFVQLQKFMNGVTDGSIHASYAVTSLVQELTDGAKVSHGEVKKFVEEGKIDLNTFTSAMEHAYGDQKALSKQFTDFVLDNVQGLIKIIDSIDMTKPMETFYYLVESAKNLAKGLFSILKPIAGAFDEVFPSFSMDKVVDLAAKIELLTSKFKLSERQSTNLKKTFKGLFDIVKLLVDIFIALVRVIIPVNEPLEATADGLLGVTAGIGETLSEFTEFVRKSPTIQKAYERISKAVQGFMTFLADVIRGLDDFLDRVGEIPAVQKLIKMISDAFAELGGIFEPLFGDIGTEFKNFWKMIEESIPTDAQAFLDGILGDIEEFANSIDQDKVLAFLKDFTNGVRDFIDLIRSNEGLDVFVQHMIEFFEGLREAFTIETLVGKIDYIMQKMGQFIDWVKTTFGPMFENISIGGIAATAGGGGLIYIFSEMIKTIEKWGKAIKPVPDTFAAVKDALKAWQKDLEADRLLKIAGAILMLAGALTLLSFADTERLLIAAGVLGGVGTALLLAIAKFQEVKNKGKDIGPILATFANNLAKGFTQLTKGLKWKLIGSMIKDIAKSLTLIAVTIIGLGIMYQKNPDAIKSGGLLAGAIAGAVIAMIGAMSKIGDALGEGMKSFSKAAGGVLAICLAVGIMVLAIKELMELELPESESEINKKMGMFASAILGVGTLIVAVGQAGKLSGGNSIKTGPILGAAVSIMIVIKALEMLLKMDIGTEDIGKIFIFAGLFVGMGYLIKTMGKASKDAGGALKGVGTLLALSFTVGVLVAALMVLSMLPFERMLTGAIGLGLVLVALGVTLKGAGAITSNNNYKSVLAIAVVIGALTAALGLLSMIPWDRLIPAVASLDLTLLSLAAVFKGMGSIKTDMFGTVLAMVAMVGVIALSLYALSNQPWDALLAAGGSMALVITAFAGVFYAIGKSGHDVDTEGTLLFLMATLSIVPIATALYVLSSQPWDGMLAAGVALSAVIGAYGFAFSKISECKVDLTAIGLFIFGTAAVIGIALALRILSDQPWDSLLAAGTAISEVLLALAGAMAIVAQVGQGSASAAIKGIGLLDLFVADLVAVLAILGGLWQFDWFQTLINGGLEMLSVIGYGLGDFVGSIIGGVGAGISKGLVEIGENLSLFMEKAEPFFEGCGKMDADVATSVKNLAEMMLMLTASELISGITEWLKGSAGEDPLVKFGEQLVKFGPKIAAFAEAVKDVSPEAVQGAASAAQIMADLADKLPRTGGFYQKVFGEKKTLAQFGEELRKFGPKIAAFAEAVKDVSPEAVQGAADAASIMADLGDRLPRTGGFYQKVFGEKKTLSEFGAELAVFGPALVLYCAAVKDITSADVTGSAQAVKILQNMADNMPDTKTLWEKIFGGGTMSLTEFAEDLVPFGTGMKKFADSVSGIESESLNGVIDSLNKLIDIAVRLEGVDPFALPTFADSLSMIGTECVDNFISAFNESDLRVIAAVTILLSKMLETFENGKENLVLKGRDTAQQFSLGFSKGINDSKLTILPVIKDFSSYIMTEITKQLSSKDSFESIGIQIVSQLTKGLNSTKPKATLSIKNIALEMIAQLTQILNRESLFLIGSNQIQWVTDGSLSKKANILQTITTIANEVLTRFRTIWTSQVYTVIGSNIVQWIMGGINSRRASLNQLTTSVATNIRTNIQNGLPYSTFNTVGQNTMIGVHNGIVQQSGSTINAASSAANSVRAAITNTLTYNQFYSVGTNIPNGLAAGINATVNRAAQSAINAARAVVNAAKSVFQINSPSKVFEGMGEGLNEGLALGIKNRIGLPLNQVENMSAKVIQAANSAFKNIGEKIRQNAPDTTITITPVLDMSEMNRNASEISRMFNSAVQNTNLQVGEIQAKFNQSEYDRNKEFSDDQEEKETLRKIMKEIRDGDMGSTFQNTFNISGDDPYKIADEVSYIIQRQVERKSKKWG